MVVLINKCTLSLSVLALVQVGQLSISALGATNYKSENTEIHAPLNDESYGEDGADEVLNDKNYKKLTEKEIREAYQVESTRPDSISKFSPPKFPDLGVYTYSSILKKIDTKKRGTVSIGSLLSEPGFKVLTYDGSVGLSTFAKRQGSGLQAIIISDGLVAANDLKNSVPSIYFEEQEPGVYIARLPILVRHGATLLLDKNVKQFRLSTEKASILSVEGKLFLLNSAILGWEEKKNSPALFKSPKAFRPFIVSWGGSELYIAQSRIAHLGYAASKGYGLSLTQYTGLQLESKVWPRPTGWLINNTIEDLWYGLYTWEADDVIMHSNVMKNNILYGFDPHDRSRRLIIANNDVFGTKIKHGIIISREVNDSWIFGNKTHNNHKSGIVLDRQCSNTIIANNIATQNGTDGITISESSNNIVWNNVVSGNSNHGIRLRNSTDVRIQDNVAIANGLTGIYGASVDLSGTDRDFVHDFYTKQLGMTVVGGQYTSNGSGPFGLDYPTKASFYGVDLRTPQRQLGYRLGGMLPPFQIELLDVLLNQNKVAVVKAHKPQLTQ